MGWARGETWTLKRSRGSGFTSASGSCGGFERPGRPCNRRYTGGGTDDGRRPRDYGGRRPTYWAWQLISSVPYPQEQSIPQLEGLQLSFQPRCADQALSATFARRTIAEIYGTAILRFPLV